MNDIPNEVLIQIDQIVIDFEEQWRAGTSSNYSQWLEKIPKIYRELLREELFATEAELRAKKGGVAENVAVLSFDKPDSQMPPSSNRIDDQANDKEAGDLGDDTDSVEVLRRIDNYELIRELKSGGMGTVYVARHHQFRDRFYAIKLVKSGWVSNEAIARFQHEINIAGQLKHPNIVFAYDAGMPAMSLAS